MCFDWKMGRLLNSPTELFMQPYTNTQMNLRYTREEFKKWNLFVKNCVFLHV